ncbi:hypothetical protein Lal_00011212, partial [Lupinus albus]
VKAHGPTPLHACINPTVTITSAITGNAFPRPILCRSNDSEGKQRVNIEKRKLHANGSGCRFLVINKKKLREEIGMLKGLGKGVVDSLEGIEAGRGVKQN